MTDRDIWTWIKLAAVVAAALIWLIVLLWTLYDVGRSFLLRGKIAGNPIGNKLEETTRMKTARAWQTLAVFVPGVVFLQRNDPGQAMLVAAAIIWGATALTLAEYIYRRLKR